MEREKIREFLYRVATDPAYRARLEQDPVGTFAELGITVDPAEVPEHIDLPSNEEILAALDELVDRILGILCLSVIHPLIWLTR